MAREDLELLDPRTGSDDVIRAIDTLRTRMAAGVDPGASFGLVVPPVFASLAVDSLRGSGVRAAAVVAYPLGFSKPTIKAIEATSLAKDGVDGVEVTLAAPRVGDCLTGHASRGSAEIRDELLEIVRGVRAARPSASTHARVIVDHLPRSDDRSARFEWKALFDAIARGAADGLILDVRTPAALEMATTAAQVRHESLAFKLAATDGALLVDEACQAGRDGWTAVGRVSGALPTLHPRAVRST